MNIYSNRLHKLVDNVLGESAFYKSFKGSDASKCRGRVACKASDSELANGVAAASHWIA